MHLLRDPPDSSDSSVVFQGRRAALEAQEVPRHRCTMPAPKIFHITKHLLPPPPSGA